MFVVPFLFLLPNQVPCNNTGFTDPKTTLGWGIVDFDWSNSKGTGAADGWAKHRPMDDEEMLARLASVPFVLVAEALNARTGVGSRFGLLALLESNSNK